MHKYCYSATCRGTDCLTGLLDRIEKERLGTYCNANGSNCQIQHRNVLSASGTWDVINWSGCATPRKCSPHMNIEHNHIFYISCCDTHLCNGPNKTGSAQISCNFTIPHGHITWWCTEASLCPFSCDEGYEEHAGVSWVSCSSSGTWISTLSWPTVTSDEFCIPKPCPRTIPNGRLSEPCAGTVGSSCGYTCHTGYQKKVGVSLIKCETSTNWSVDPHSLCTNAQQCPYELANGDLDLSCRRALGDTCMYTCHLGYLPSSPLEATSVTCTYSASYSWTKPLSSLCTELRCSDTIPNGYIGPACSREYGSYCYNYQCNPDYNKTPASPSLKCNASGLWYWSKGLTKALCTREEDLCPSTFSNGEIVWHCSRQPGDTCTYNCRSGCKESSVSWLTCRANGTWDHETDLLCENCPDTTTRDTTKISTTAASTYRCSAYIPNGKIWSNCSRSPSSRCRYTCNSGCKPFFDSLICYENIDWASQRLACSCSGSDTTLTVSTASTSTPYVSYDCSAYIPNGLIWRNCSRTLSSRCGFTCYSGCKPFFNKLICDENGNWYARESACDCSGILTTIEPPRCPAIINNGWIAYECREMSYFSVCSFECNTGCLAQYSSLFCRSDGKWDNQDDACSCYDAQDEAPGNIGVIVGSILGLLILIGLLITVTWLIRSKNRRRMQQEQQHGRVNQGTNFQSQTADSINIVEPNRAYSLPLSDANGRNQYTTLQYNNYETPYSSIQLPTRDTIGSAPPEYASLDDINSRSLEHGYTAISDAVKVPKDPPPSYEETTSHPAYFKVQER